MVEMAPLKIAIIGSGNWGTAIARIIGGTIKENPNDFESVAKMWVVEETVNGRKLTDIINSDHENVKYLPGKKIPVNIVAVPNLVDSVANADILVFVIPHQFVVKICDGIVGKIKPTAFGISLIKGVLTKPDGSMKLITEEIEDKLKIEMSVLMGANISNEVAEERFCEATIGCRNAAHDVVLKKLFQTQNFRIAVVEDDKTVEVCGALKDIVACAAGFCDGLDVGDSTRAAVIRLGLYEMVKFAEYFYKNSKQSTFFESCGVADIIASCSGGRNKRCSEAFVAGEKSIGQLEKDMLNGQKLQGPETAAEVNVMIKALKLEKKFPLLTAVHQIFTKQIKPEQLIDCLHQHPAHM